MSPHSAPNRAKFLLAFGGAVGVALAAAGLVTPGHTTSNSLPLGTVARVNGQAIRAEEYERAVSALAGDRRAELDDEQRRQVLDRLIDEELLIQRGLDLGLAQVDRKVRADITAAVVAGIVSEYESLQPSDAEIEAFYRENRNFFSSTGRFHVRQVFCRVADASEAGPASARANQAAERLRAGEDFTAVRNQLGDQELAPLPDAALPPAKLRDYLGPTALQVALTMSVGGVSDPIRSGTGYHVLQLVERQPGDTPPLQDIRSQVVAELRRRAGDNALRAYLDDLRNRADVVVRSELP